ncbi:hypothetical protein EDM68_00645 [Candidatus Uhrbacteria bacterium]|nr:MAG: hypothetical protein EDM68_00645 [Candidatus Uhrbacteria bacterium]
MLSRLCSALVLTLVLTCAGFPVIAQAATAGVSGPSQVRVGTTFRVNLVISGAKDVDTVRFVGTFPADLLELQGMANGSALPNRSPGSGSGNGSFNLGAFSLGAAVNGGATVGTLTFRAKKTGEAVISLVSGTTILSAGESQLTGQGGLRIAITEAPPPSEAPAIPVPETKITLASPSHPNENAWYANRTVAVTWDVTGRRPQAVYIGFDQAPEGPAEERRAERGEIAHTVPHDGVWYAHLVVRFSATEIERRDFRFQVDTTPPRAFAVVADHTDVVPTTPNALRFAALDDASGVRAYDVWINDVHVTSTAENAFALIRLPAGEYAARVRATDAAGNSAEATTSFRILPVLPAEATVAIVDGFRDAAVRWILTTIIAIMLFFSGYWYGRTYFQKRRKSSAQKRQKF